METTRQKKVARQIQKDLAEIILKINNLIYPKSLISVSKVRISPDLSYAKVYLSVFPLKDQKKFLKSGKISPTRIYQNQITGFYLN